MQQQAFYNGHFINDFFKKIKQRERKTIHSVSYNLIPASDDHSIGLAEVSILCGVAALKDFFFGKC